MEKKLVKLLSEAVSQDRIREHALEMHRLEGNCSHSNFKASTDYAMQCMKEAGFSNIERKALAADGKTAHFDCIMPQAWEMKKRAFLRLEEKFVPASERMIADSDTDPFNAGVWGAPTPGKEPLSCQIVDLDSIEAGQDHLMKDKLVLCSGGRAQYCRICDSGALGMIVSDSKVGEEYPDFCRWSNGIGRVGWYHTAGERRVVIFDITPRKAQFLRKLLAEKGTLKATALSQSRIYNGEIYTVSGIIPGKSKEELTFFSHMYEPFVPDDAAGGMIAIEMCRALKQLIDEGKLPPLQKTLKVVLSMECYGYYEYFEDKEQFKKILSVFSFDSSCHKTLPGKPRVKLRKSSFLAPFFGDRLFEEIFRKYAPGFHYSEEKGSLSDDTFCATEDWKIPAIWPHTSCPAYHHNSGPAFMDADFSLAYDVARFMGTLTGIMALTEKDKAAKIVKKVKKLEKEDLASRIEFIKQELKLGKLALFDAPAKIRFYADFASKRLMNFNRFWKNAVSEEDCASLQEMARKAIDSLPLPDQKQALWGAEKQAAAFVVKRRRGGTLMSLANVPQKERRNISIPDIVYMSLDGKRSLRDAVKMFEYENDRVMTDTDYAQYIADLRYLEKYEYVKITVKKK